MITTLLRRLALILTTLPLLLLTSKPGTTATASSFTVTRTSDSYDGVCDGDCSLREAITAANNNPGPDTITLDVGTYRLSQAGAGEDLNGTGDLDILEGVTLLGAGAGYTSIDAQDIDRVFDILTDDEVLISGLAVRNGQVSDNGGGVRCTTGASLSLTNVSLESSTAVNGGGLYANVCIINFDRGYVSGNSALDGGGIYVDGGSDLNLVDTYVLINSASQAGGGIYSHSSEVTMTGSLLIINQANGGSGGGLLQWGDNAFATLESSVIADNSASSEGGGVFFLEGSGAGAVIRNSTISSNRANTYGGGINTRVPTLLESSTVVDNVADYDGNAEGDAGGVLVYSAGGVLTVRNTILANNTDNNNAAYADCMVMLGGTNISLGYNLVENNVESVARCVFTGSGEVLGQDPMLGPFQVNGGITFTHALLAGSPAINAGDPAFAPPPAFDQRGPGYPRLIGRIDIGAFEYALHVFLPVIQKH